MTALSENLSAHQSRALAALLVCPTISQAAKACGLHERTIRRYLEDWRFRAAYLEARRAVVSQATAQLQAAGAEAVEALRDVMGDKAAPASARVSAARAVLELGHRGLEDEDLAHRLEVLEQRYETETESMVS
jgi:hypothetical protein